MENWIGTLLEDGMSLMVSNYKDNHLVSNSKKLFNFPIFSAQLNPFLRVVVCNWPLRKNSMVMTVPSFTAVVVSNEL